MKRLFGLKPLTILDLAAFCAMAGLLFAKAWIDMDYNWDSLAYHVPFAALRTGLVSPDQYILPPSLQAVFDGFPVVQDYLKGWLWKFSGNVNAVNLPTVAALVGMCVALAAMLRLPFSLLLFAAMGIPVIHVAAAKNYVDLISNAAFATALVFILDSFMNTQRVHWRNLVVVVAGAVIAASVKPQFVILSLCLLAALVAYNLWFFRRRPLAAFERPEWINWSMIVAGVGLVLIIPVRNLYTFGNPLYPVAWSLFGHSFPGPYPANLSQNWDPAYLRGTAQPLKWILSILEFHALDSRYTPYTLGMADVGPDAKSLRMGGYFGFYVVFNLLVLAYIVFRKRDRRAYLFAAAFLIGSVATASLPASHELRYFSFWMLILVFANIYFVFGSYFPDPTLRFVLFAAAVSATTFIVMVSGGRYIMPVGETLRATFNGLQIKEKFVGKFEPGHVYCLVNWGQFHLLAAPGLAAPAERPYTVQVAHHGREECRPGSEVVEFTR
jgi:hypothetical protein